MTQYIHVHVRNLLMSVFVNVCHAVSTLCLPLSSEVKTLVSWIQNRAQQMNRETLKGESTQSGLQWSYIIVWMQRGSLFDTHYYHNFVLTSAVSDKISIVNISEMSWENPAQLVPLCRCPSTARPFLNIPWCSLQQPKANTNFSAS